MNEFTSNKLTLGSVAIDCSVKTLYGEESSLLDLLNRKKIVFFLLRDSACVLTQHEIQKIADSNNLFKKCNAEVIAVVQSTPEAAIKSLSKPIPFTILCDAIDGVYASYGTEIADSKETLGNDMTMKAIEDAKACGYVHGEDVGNSLQLPAVIIFDDLRVKYVHYAKTADDIPDIQDLIKILT